MRSVNMLQQNIYLLTSEMRERRIDLEEKLRDMDQNSREAVRLIMVINYNQIMCEILDALADGQSYEEATKLLHPSDPVVQKGREGN